MSKAITNMRVERILRDKTQRQVAESLGISQVFYMDLELLRMKPTEQRVRQLEEYYQKPISYLLSIAE